MPWVENEGGTSTAGSGGQAPGTPAYNPAWYALTAIWIDPVNGSDVNTGSAIGSPLKTWGEVVRRYGSTEPLFNYGQSCTYTFLNSQPAGSDPIFFEPRLTGGGQAILTATTALFQAGTFTELTAKVRGAGGAGSLLKVTTSGAGVATNMLMVNTTRNSQALVDSVAGQLATMQQPQTLASLGSTAVVPNPVEDDTWANGDNYSLYTLLSLNLKRWRPVGGDETAGSQPCGGWVFTASIADPSGTGASVYLHGCTSTCNVLVNCVVNGRTHATSEAGRGDANYVIGCSHVGAYISYGGVTQVFGGGFAAGYSCFTGYPGIDNDAVIHNSLNQDAGTNYLGKVFCDGTINVFGGQLQANSFLWGSYSINVFPGASFLNQSGSTFVLRALLTSGTVKLNSVATGYSFTAATGLWGTGTALTPAAIDAAPGNSLFGQGGGYGYISASGST